MTARMYSTAAAVVSWSGVLLQAYLTVVASLAGGRSVVDGLILFFGYFTITTNILVCLALTLPLLSSTGTATRFFARSFSVAGIAAQIAFVALAYHFLLRKAWDPQGAQLFADVLLHYVVPALFVAYWFLYWRNGSLRWVYPLYWSLYPTAYFIYVLVRGEIIGAYPYAFIDVAAIGYRHVVANAVALLLAVIGLGLLIVLIDRSARRPITVRSAP
jgi:hypothetical protein